MTLEKGSMNPAKPKKMCKKCSRLMDIKEFYGSSRLDKYPDGRVNECKKCLTMHVDNWNPDTYLWILEELNLPYIEHEWNATLAKYKDNPGKVTGMSVLGKYISKMKLNQWRNYVWDDTEKIKTQLENAAREELKNNDYSDEEIDKYFKETKENSQVENFVAEYKKQQSEKDPEGAAEPIYQQSLEEQYFSQEELTEDDVRYLVLKWGDYKPYEWVKLEQLYNDMMESFDIQNAGHIDTLKLACKASLKTHQLLDLGDIDGALRSSRMYDTLMKSGKFTAAQNKETSGEFVDSVGELVALCEEQGYIERLYVDTPKDKVDATLQDMNQYTKTLVTEELNLSNLIENALNKIKEQAEFEAREDMLDEDDSENTFEDYDEFFTMVEQEVETDLALVGDEEEANFEIVMPPKGDK